MTIVYALVSREKTVLAEYTATSGTSVCVRRFYNEREARNNSWTLSFVVTPQRENEMAFLIHPFVEACRINQVQNDLLLL